jgi:hypothetical protein
MLVRVPEPDAMTDLVRHGLFDRSFRPRIPVLKNDIAVGETDELGAIEIMTGPAGGETGAHHAGTRPRSLDVISRIVENDHVDAVECVLQIR